MFSSKEIHFRNKKIILGGILILALIVTMNRIPTNDIIKDSVKLEPFPIPRASFSFSNTSITIDEDAVSNTTHSGNWAWAADQPWCTGFGTADQPYVIQDMIFDIPADHSGISIINSHNIFFIIQDCTFENSSTSWTEGVRFENTSNGTISNCVFNHNWHAIYFLSDSDYNNIWNCNVYNSSYNGIEVRTGSDFNNISHNI